MIVAWILFPLVITALAGGWGLLLCNVARLRVDGLLVVPLGFTAMIVVSGLVTAWPAIAPADITVVTLGALTGLARPAVALARRRSWPAGADRAAIVAAIGVYLLYGAPVILSGAATFTGYIRLDDTSTWLAMTDLVTSHGRSVAGLPQSTFRLLLDTNLHASGYPIGVFMPLGVARGVMGTDAAWVFQPYLSWCAAISSLALGALLRPLLPGSRLRALVAGIAASSALLYGYAMWGGIKELAGAALLALLAATAAAAARGQEGPSDTSSVAVLAPLAITSAATADALGPGAVAYVGPALVLVAGARVWRGRRTLRPVAVQLGALGGAIAVLMLPVWLVIGSFISSSKVLFSSGAGTDRTALGNLAGPLEALQLGGIWPTGDFRYAAPVGWTAPLMIALLGGLVALVMLAAPKQRHEPAALAAVMLGGCAVVWVGGSGPWLVGKALAMGSIALPALGLAGALLLAVRIPAAGIVLAALIVGGVVASDVLAYREVTLAPKDRLDELQQVDSLLPGHTPTLVNEYDPYADRHFLRDGAPVEPGEYRPVTLTLSSGQELIRSAATDLDALPPATVVAYPSIVQRAGPSLSRPPAEYALRWRGRYYELWQRPAGPTRLLEHISFGETGVHPYCGRSKTSTAPLCPLNPVATAPCPFVRGVAADARRRGADLIAYERQAPVIARADQAVWPGAWGHYPASATLVPTTPGVVTAHIRLINRQRYGLWLGGSFARGFEVTIDGRRAGHVRDELANLGELAPVGNVRLAPGVHTIALRYSASDLAPGSGSPLTSLTAIVLEPLDSPAPRLLHLTPAQATTLCGRTLDWIELVRPSVR